MAAISAEARRSGRACGTKENATYVSSLWCTARRIAVGSSWSSHNTLGAPPAAASIAASLLSQASCNCRMVIRSAACSTTGYSSHSRTGVMTTSSYSQCSGSSRSMSCPSRKPMAKSAACDRAQSMILTTARRTPSAVGSHFTVCGVPSGPEVAGQRCLPCARRGIAQVYDQFAGHPCLLGDAGPERRHGRLVQALARRTTRLEPARLAVDAGGARRTRRAGAPPASTCAGRLATPALGRNR